MNYYNKHHNKNAVMFLLLIALGCFAACGMAEPKDSQVCATEMTEYGEITTCEPADYNPPEAQ